MLDFDDMARREITSGSAAIAMRFLARYTEPFARLLAQLLYGGNERPELSYRFERFKGC